jgi:hypothetical protein
MLENMDVFVAISERQKVQCIDNLVVLDVMCCA